MTTQFGAQVGASSLVLGWVEGNRSLIQRIQDGQARQRTVLCTVKLSDTTTELSFVDTFDLAAAFPIPPYLRHMFEDETDPFLSPGHYSRILNNLVMGEAWFCRPETRLNILDLLTRQDRFRSYRRLAHLSLIAKLKVACLLISEAQKDSDDSDRRTTLDFFTHARGMLLKFSDEQWFKDTKKGLGDVVGPSENDSKTGVPRSTNVKGSFKRLFRRGDKGSG